MRCCSGNTTWEILTSDHIPTPCHPLAGTFLRLLRLILDLKGVEQKPPVRAHDCQIYTQQTLLLCFVPAATHVPTRKRNGYHFCPPRKSYHTRLKNSRKSQNSREMVLLHSREYIAKLSRDFVATDVSTEGSHGVVMTDVSHFR